MPAARLYAIFLFSIFSLTCRNPAAIVVLPKFIGGKDVNDMQSTMQKDALYFVTEQACCLAQATGRETDDFRTCQDAAEYLARGDAETLTAFWERTEAVQRDLTGYEDYDTEQYEGKIKDARDAVSSLSRLGAADGTPEKVRGSLLKAADIIAAFYDVDDAVPAVPA
jgi:cytosine/adenosine deaminase-related metal-dependent hydrolase